MTQADPGVIRRELFIEAEPATVFAFLTDPDKLTRWMGVQCELDAEPHGVYLVNVNGRDVARGEFEESRPIPASSTASVGKTVPWACRPAPQGFRSIWRPRIEARC